MSEQFSILIDSRTRFETGEPGGVWLSMPTTKEQLHEAMQRVGITADNPQNFFINGFANTEQQPFDVPLPVIQSAGLDELNYLGNLLAMQRDEDRDKFTAAVALGERAGSVKDLINLAQNLDCYWLYPTVQNEEDYGYYPYRFSVNIQQEKLIKACCVNLYPILSSNRIVSLCMDQFDASFLSA